MVNIVLRFNTLDNQKEKKIFSIQIEFHRLNYETIRIINYSLAGLPTTKRSTTKYAVLPARLAALSLGI